MSIPDPFPMSIICPFHNVHLRPFPNVNRYSCAAVSGRIRNVAEILPQIQEKIQGSFHLGRKISTKCKQ